MSANRRPIELGPSATINLADVDLWLFDDVHPNCNPECYADCSMIAAVHKPTGCTSKVYSSHALDKALIDLMRKVAKEPKPVPKLIKLQVTPEISTLPAHFQDWES